MESKDGICIFNDVLGGAFKSFKSFVLKNPGYVGVFSRLAASNKKQANLRAQNQKRGLTVPPILIFSVTNRCNLACRGCYACAQGRDLSGELDIKDIDRIVSEAKALGTSIVLFAGGEPLIKDGLFGIAAQNPQMLFLLFSNGLLFDVRAIEQIKANKHIIPVISIEGDEETTDARRGKGVYKAVMATAEKLKANKIVFGSSITLTSQNYDMVVNEGFIKDLKEMGSLAVFMIEYVPGQDDMELCLLPEQKASLDKNLEAMQKKIGSFLVALPGDEDMYGGCLAAGRGFVHVSSEGRLEACPFAPYSDVSLKNMSLEEALRSPLMKKIRDNHGMLTESRGGCTLWENKEWVEQAQKEVSSL